MKGSVLLCRITVSCLLLFSASVANACVYKEAVVVVDGVRTGGYGFWDCSGGGSGGGGGGSGSGDPGFGGGGVGGGSEGGEADRQAQCQFLQSTKPDNCPNPVAEPVGSDYGVGSYAGGSGLPKLIYLKNSGLVTQGEKDKLAVALFMHTIFATQPTTPSDQANMQLIWETAAACDMMVANSPFGTRDATRKCHEAVEILTREAGGKPFAAKFSAWLDLNKFNIGYGFFDLETAVGFFAPENSLTIKWKNAQSEAACSRWWTKVQENQCGLP